MLTIYITLMIIVTTTTLIYSVLKFSKKETPLKNKIVALASGLFASNSILYILMTDLRIEKSGLRTEMFLLIRLLPIFIALLFLISQKIRLNERILRVVPIYIVKIFVILINVPLFTIYILRHEPIKTIVFGTIVVTLLLLSLFIIFEKLLEGRYSRKTYTGYLILFAMFFFSFFLVTNLDDSSGMYTSYSNTLQKFMSLDDEYDSENIIEFDDILEEGTIVDFYMSNENLYYIIEDSNTVYLKIYSILNDSILAEYHYDLPEDNSGWIFIHTNPTILEEIDGVLYFFGIDGIYTIHTDVLTKIDDYTLLQSLHFEIDDTHYFAYEISESTYDIYKIDSEGVIYIETLDYSLESDVYRFYTLTNTLLIYNSSAGDYTMYNGATISEPVCDGYSSAVLVNDSAIIFKCRDSNFSNIVYYANYPDGTSTEIEVYEDSNTYNYSLINENFIKTSYLHEIGTETTNFYDNLLQKTDQMSLYLFSNEKIIGSNHYLVRSFDDDIYYAASGKANDRLIIEINQLNKLEKTVDYAYFDTISILNISIAMSILILFSFQINKNTENENVEIPDNKTQ